MKLEENYDSDISEDEEQYSNLADAVSQLDSTRRIQPVTRKEFSSVVSEFYLPNEISDLVNENELANALSSNSSQSSISKQVRNVMEGSETLPIPLEKPVAERIQRSMGYRTIKSEFTKWNPVVDNYRIADNLDFPLHNEKVTLKTSHEFFSQFKTQTPLEMEISKILNGVRDSKDKKDEESDSDENNKFPLTLEEMIAQKKEMAQIRAKISYAETKAHRKSKIKSKKYHKILKKEKIKKKVEDFEQLQKTDPEAALKKLEELDKTRAQERASLRHKNTGKWAKNLAIRAKYNKESRKVLAEQLKLSKELTQKVKSCASKGEDSSESESDSMEQKDSVTSDENPWDVKATPEVTDFVSKCKKYWREEIKKRKLQRNECEVNSEQLTEEELEDLTPTEGEESQIENDGAENLESTVASNNLNTKETQEDTSNETESADSDTLGKNRKSDEEPLNLIKARKFAYREKCKKTGINSKIKSEIENIHNNELDKDSSKMELSEDPSIVPSTSTGSPNCVINDSDYNIDSPEKILKTKKKWLYRSLAQSESEKNSQNSNNATNKLPGSENDDKISTTDSPKSPPKNNESEDKTIQEKKKKVNKKEKSSADLDDLFDELDGAEAAKTLKKLLEIKKKSKQKKKKNNKNKRKHKNKNNENFNTRLKKDSASMKPEIDVEMAETTEENAEEENNDVDVLNEKEVKLCEEDAFAEIDPKKFIELKPKKLDTRLSNEMINGDYLDDDEEIHRMNVAEAFNDDDVIVEFQEKKKEEEESTKCKLADSLPGWGSWGGQGIKPSKKRKKITPGMSELPKRKDHNKKDTIISEKANSNIVPHLVKEVPFPFKSVGAFESNMRNPIGREFVPETAHRNLIKKPVETELGKIIEPMDKNELLQFKATKSLFKGKSTESNKKS